MRRLGVDVDGVLVIGVDIGFCLIFGEKVLMLVIEGVFGCGGFVGGLGLGLDVGLNLRMNWLLVLSVGLGGIGGGGWKNLFFGVVGVWLFDDVGFGVGFEGVDGGGCYIVKFGVLGVVGVDVFLFGVGMVWLFIVLFCGIEFDMKLFRLLNWFDEGVVVGVEIWDLWNFVKDMDDLGLVIIGFVICDWLVKDLKLLFMGLVIGFCIWLGFSELKLLKWVLIGGFCGRGFVLCCFMEFMDFMDDGLNMLKDVDVCELLIIGLEVVCCFGCGGRGGLKFLFLNWVISCLMLWLLVLVLLFILLLFWNDFMLLSWIFFWVKLDVFILFWMKLEWKLFEVVV